MIKVTLVNGGEAEFSYQQGFIMLHADCISSQWHPDTVGVLMEVHEGFVKVGFMAAHTGAMGGYQSFLFEMGDLDKLETFFKGLRFPLHSLKRQ